MLHRHNNLGLGRYQVHRATHSSTHLAGDDPIRNITSGTTLKCPKHCHVQMMTSDDAERGRGAEI